MDFSPEKMLFEVDNSDESFAGGVSLATKSRARKLTSRTDKRVAKTRTKLLKAALEVFSEYGVDAATIDDITERADLGKGTFYRHFGDKREIITCLVGDAIEHLISSLNNYKTKSNTIEDVLEQLLDVHYNFFIENSEEFILLFQGRLLLKLDRKISEQMETPFNNYLQQIENHISPFVSEKVDIIRIRRLACAVAGFVFGFFSFTMIGIGTDEIATSIKPLRQSFVRSLSVFLAQ
jgi:AcrR family transcriptional regulator